MATNASVPTLVLEHPNDDPEHYEFIRGQWLKKHSAGREDHSKLELALVLLLTPIAARLKCKVLFEWTIIHNEEKLIPDVTFSFPDARTEDGYLVAPPFLTIETCSKAQRARMRAGKGEKEHAKSWAGERETETVLRVFLRSAKGSDASRREKRNTLNLGPASVKPRPSCACSSEGQRINTLSEKWRKDYHRIGTPYCWVLDPEQKTAYECHRETSGANRQVTRLTAGPGIALSIADLGWPLPPIA